MRILLVSHYQVPHLGGVETIVDEVATRLAERGHRVAVVSSAAGGSAVPRPYESLRVAAYNGFEARVGVPYPVFSPRLLRVLAAECARADVVHAHGWLYQGSVAALALARARGRARVLTEHVAHVPYESKLLDVVQGAAVLTCGRFCARSADALVTYNERVRRQVALQAPGREQVTIANGTDLTRFRPPAPGERERLRAALGWDERPRALFAGRLVAKKGFDVALAAARQAGGAFRFVVAGPERLPGAPADVELLGRLAPERLAEVYRACDAIVIPSFGEGLPLTAQEAMASGLPVVITDDPGYRSQLAPAGPAVRLVPSGVEALAAALRAAVRARDEAPDAVAAMVAFARETFSWERTADAHEALYERLLSSRSGVATWRRGAGSGS